MDRKFFCLGYLVITALLPPNGHFCLGEPSIGIHFQCRERVRNGEGGNTRGLDVWPIRRDRVRYRLKLGHWHWSASASFGIFLRVGATPFPITNLRQVLAVLVDIASVLDQLIF